MTCMYTTWKFTCMMYAWMSIHTLIVYDACTCIMHALYLHVHTYLHNICMEMHVHCNMFYELCSRSMPFVCIGNMNVWVCILVWCILAIYLHTHMLDMYLSNVHDVFCCPTIFTDFVYKSLVQSWFALGIFWMLYSTSWIRRFTITSPILSKCWKYSNLIYSFLALHYVFWSLKNFLEILF